MHEHAVRHHGRGPDPDRPARAPGCHRSRGHAGRQGEPGTRGVQRSLRLRPGRHGQLGVLRQHDPRQRARPRRWPAVRRQDHAAPRPGSPVHLAGGLPDPGGLPRRAGGTRPPGRARQPGRPAAGQGAPLDGPAAARRRQRGDRTVSGVLTPVLTAHWDEPDSFTLEGYRREGGYQALEKALRMPQDDIVAALKGSGLRGRGGAGFPTGVKWGFIPQGEGKPHYLVVNADESEPGTCKDVPLMMASPHMLIEGAVITSYAIHASHAFIYVRGEVLHVVRRLQQAINEVYEAGFVGQDILGTGYHVELVLHAGAGAYICGEETALLDSLEGYRGQPRLKPPFPAVEGLYACPTVINNVES